MRRHVTRGLALALVVLLFLFYSAPWHPPPPPLPHNINSVVADIHLVTCFSRRACRHKQSTTRRLLESDLYTTSRAFWKLHTFLLIDTSEQTASKVVQVSTRPPDHVDSQVTWESRGPLWVQFAPRDEPGGVSSLDVFYGDDSVDPRPHCTIVGRVDQSEAHLSVCAATDKSRDHNTHEDASGHVTYDARGHLKIVQVADLHFSTGPGQCRDPFPAHGYAVGADQGNCLADATSVQFLRRVLDAEKPQLVVFTGDQVNGQTSAHAKTALYKALEPAVTRQVPFALVFGNHDDEGTQSRDLQMAWARDLPGCVAQHGDSHVRGVGNYAVVVGPTRLFFLDSHSKLAPGGKFYDSIDAEQIDSVVASRNDHPGDRALSMAFFHIPLPEYSEAGLQNTRVGSFRERVMSPQSSDALARLQSHVHAISVGHDHVNDFCSEHESVWLCYGGGAGEGGYGGYGGYERRLRVFDFNKNDRTISTWKWLRTGGIIDKQVLAAGGRKAVVLKGGSLGHDRNS